MICEPSPLPTCINPIVLTRQLLQPSLNFLEPIRTLIAEPGLLICSNSEPLNSFRDTSKPLSSHFLHSLVAFPTLITPNGSAVPTRKATSPDAPFNSST